MNLSELELINFRNYKKLKISFGKNINILYGDNAVGKTNILEAIFLTCITKSHKAQKDFEMVLFNQKYSKVKASFNNDIVEIYLEETKKIVKENEIQIKKLKDIIGKRLVVLFSPESLEIIKGAPAQRRKFLDILISQISKKYLLNLQEYNKYLKIKNNILKQENKIDFEYLNIIDEKLSEKIKEIVEERKEYIELINKKIKKIHSKMTNEKEIISLEYKTEFLNKTVNEILILINKNRKTDIIKKTSTKGVNNDNMLIYINKEEVCRYCSQGQNRTSLLSLKFTEVEILEEKTEKKPIILLDDVFSELDNNRINYLLEFIKNNQVFITTTDIQNLEITKKMKVFKIDKDGFVKLIDKC